MFVVTDNRFADDCRLSHQVRVEVGEVGGGDRDEVHWMFPDPILDGGPLKDLAVDDGLDRRPTFLKEQG